MNSKENTLLVKAGELRIGDVIVLTNEMVVGKGLDNCLKPKNKWKVILRLRSADGLRVTDWGYNTQIRISR